MPFSSRYSGARERLLHRTCGSIAALWVTTLLLSTGQPCDCTDAPTPAPTPTRPSLTNAPTPAPTSHSPARAPTRPPMAPTHAPSPAPTTASPTHAPTDAPTTPPTAVPTAAPTKTPTASPTAAPTATPTNAPTTPCDPVRLCLLDASCRKCVTRLASASAKPLQSTPYQNHHSERAFFSTLISSSAASVCNSSASVALVNDAVRAIALLNCSLNGVPQNWTSSCMTSEYRCFRQGSCLRCLEELLFEEKDKYETLAQPYCQDGAAQPILTSLANDCVSFPTCTWSKYHCRDDASCLMCLEALQADDGALAAQRCTTPSLTASINTLVQGCTSSTMVACDFWRERCRRDELCLACGTLMDFGSSGTAVWQAALQPECARLRNNSASLNILHTYFAACPPSVTSECPTYTFDCTMTRGSESEQCAKCLNGSAADPSACEAILAVQVIPGCASCGKMHALVNRVVFWTQIVGIVSAVACVVVAASIFAYRRDRRSKRDRIVLGLLLANAVYSTANAIPLNKVVDVVPGCGELALSFDTIRFGRAWWFCGKYAIIGWETMIIVSSIAVLSGGSRAVSALGEAAMHAASVLCGAAAFTGFYIRCAQINADGYNARTQHVAEADAHAHFNDDDQVDDDNPLVAATHKYDEAHDAFDTLTQTMLQVWAALLGVAVLLWVCQGCVHRRVARSWRKAVEKTVQEHHADSWGETRPGHWRARHQLMLMQKDAIVDIVRPLELYVLIFIFFGVPAVVMATDFCADRSHSRGDTTLGASNNAIHVGTCDVWCEFALSFRSAAAVLIYCLSAQRRREVFYLWTMLGLLWARLGACVCWSDKPAKSKNNPYEMVSLAASMEGKAEEAWMLTEDDVEIHLDQPIAEGSFGSVVRGVWRADHREVAVKVLRAAAVDSDGDPLDPGADEDLRRECAVIAQVNHPNLLKFYGFGVTSDGHGFIVTEMMTLGSLEGVLHDDAQALPWPTRVSIATQIARGMRHLHAVGLVHRDLKSANVLLAEGSREDMGMRVAIADFGTSQHFRPSPPRVVISPFTGVMFETSAADTEALGLDGAGAAPSGALATTHSTASVSVFNANGAMTQSVGTLLWMAPEIFRGDTHYSKAVDVYSFGVVMWELTTRELPWNALGLNIGHCELTRRLAKALQAGRRPAIREDVRDEHPRWVRLLEQCWEGDPERRPSFEAAVQDLEAMAHGASSTTTATSSRTKSRRRQRVAETSLTQPLLDDDQW